MSGSALRRVQPDHPSAATIQTLTQVWERMLQRSPIAATDQFFDVGGTDLLADHTFAEIARIFGRKLPAATICYAPTISALAELMELPALPRFSPLVPLRAGSRRPPVFIAPGVGGRASFSELAKHVQIGNPIYGIQAKGVDGMEEPLPRIEEMAEYYLDALRELQPEGPYILIGYSFGGLVALEMAQRLIRGGNRIALLSLVDAYPHPRHLPLDQQAWLEAKRFKNHLFNLDRTTLRNAFGKILGSLPQLHESEGERRSEVDFDNLSFARATEHVKENDFRALRRYRPLFYPGKICFVRPETNSYLPNDPAAVWKNLAAEFEVETVPGDHLSMVGKHFRGLAAVLTRYVREASPE